MLHTPVSRASSSPDIAVAPGLPAQLDDLAARLDPRLTFLRRAWFAAAGGAGVRTLIARKDGQPVAAIPTAKVGWWPVRSVPGSYWPFRSLPIAAQASDADLIALLRDGSGLGPAWRVGPVNADDPAVARLVALAPQAGWSVIPRRIATAFLFDIAAARREGAWPRGSTLKKNRFHEKHLAEHGALEWRFVSGADWTGALFDDLAAIERHAWVGQKAGADGKFADPVQRRVWEQAVADPALAAMVKAGLLYVGGAPAAFSFGIEAGPVRYCIATSYDPRFAKHSPGKLLTYRTWLDAAERGITVFDDGAGDGGHKSTMGSSPGPEIMDYLFVRGRLAAAVAKRFWR